MHKLIGCFLSLALLCNVYAQRPACGDSVDSSLRKVETILFPYPDSSKVILDHCLSKATECNDTLGIAKTLNWIGLYHQNIGDYDNATKYYFEAIEISEKKHYLKDQFITANNIGTLFFHTGDYKQAGKYYNQALKGMKELQDSAWLSKVYGNFAGVYFMSKEYDKCIKTLERSMEMAIASKRYEAVGGALANLAMVHATLGNPESALEAYDKGILLLDSVGDTRGACIAMEQKANTMINMGEIDLAIDTYKKVIDKAIGIHHIESVMKSYKGLSSIYAKKKDFAKSLEYHQNYSSWKDSLLTAEKVKSLAEMNEKYQTSQKEKEIAYLTQEGQLKDQLVQRKQRERNYLIITSILLVLVVALVIYQLKQKNQLNTALTEKNRLVKNALVERETLIKEIHHRVKNNLQIIASMLNIQAASLEDKKIKEALLESRKRVQSMSLVHQKLYRAENVQEVAIKEYLEHVLTEVESYHELESDKEIEIQTNISSFDLHVDSAIPLGLILTELVTNAFKHAFNQVEKGKITVELKKEKSRIDVSVKDDGIGMEDNDFSQSGSFGVKLVNSLIKSLDTQITWSNNNGTKAAFSFKV